MKKKKLTKETVAKIKSDICAKLTQPAIAKKYGISRSTVSDIATDRLHADVPWPENRPIKVSGGQHKPAPNYDPDNTRIQELEAEIEHLRDERNHAQKRAKSNAKQFGLFRSIVAEMDERIKPIAPLPPAYKVAKSGLIEEHLVMHCSDMHADQIVTPEECGGLERYDFQIACARAEQYVETTIDFTQRTLAGSYRFTDLWFLSYGDQTSGEIHGHSHRSYFRNMFRNCLAIGQLQSLMLRDLAPYFERVHVVCLSGNHGRRSVKKDYNRPTDNWDTLIAEVANLHCRDLPNVSFLIPEAYSVNLDINGSGFNISHGDDVRSNGGIPWYGFVRRQKSLMALNSAHNGTPLRYFVCGHHHALSSLSDHNGELIVNGAWPGTDSYSYNSFAGYREPVQLLHGVHKRHGITWKLGVKLKRDGELNGPKRYKIRGASEVAVPS